ncbi:DUF542 domain-containing protein [Deinococcus reticulitermitis]|uniref:DUF542 domain-containing protein n=1 Tax=Deinococcus reticulitermitis TaxID=856736 RepID=UPI0015A6F462
MTSTLSFPTLNVNKTGEADPLEEAPCPLFNPPIGEFIAQHPGYPRFFEELRPEYGCGGERSFQDAGAKKGLDAATVLATLEAAESLQTPHAGPHPAELTLTELADHTVDTLHALFKGSDHDHCPPSHRARSARQGPRWPRPALSLSGWRRAAAPHPR